MEESKTKLYPMMPLRDIVVFPHMVAPLMVGRPKSIEALEDAMTKGTEIFMATQKASSVDDPLKKDIYTIGTLAKIMQLLRLPDGNIKALVEGKKRGKILSYVHHDDFLQVEVEELADTEDLVGETIAYDRELRKLFGQYERVNKKIAKEVLKTVENVSDTTRLVDMLTPHLPMKTEEKQEILELDYLPDRIVKLLEFIHKEIQLTKMEQKISEKVKKNMSETQRQYYLNEKIRVIQKEMGEGEGGLDELGEIEESIKKKKLSKLVREKVTKEFKKLKSMPPMSAETTVVRNYIDCILNLPWLVKSKSKIDINKAEKILDEDHYGLKKPKERILEYLAVQAQVKKIKGPIICLVGPPGVGKTSICKSIARAMERKFVRLSLGGVRDEAEIRGHRRTYIGAMPGKIIQSMQKVKVNNPVFCLDEVDKMSTDFRGDPSSALLEVLDPEQNNAFNDHYLDIDYDLSEVFFITTANYLHGIPVPLQDRMEIIQISGYTEEEKGKIAEGFLVPKQLEANGFKENAVQISQGAIMEIIRRYTREAGVRNLERSIASVCRKVARDRLKKKIKTKVTRITAQSILKLLGTAKFRYGLAEENDQIGLSTGLAWTEVGGELLQIEATIMPGSGKLIITGKLGDVMQESAQAALSYVRSRSMRFGLEADFYKKLDIHVHVPEGAIPKDGPSAGITITTALISALLKIPVRHQLAMTGEITLRGRVLPIGGLTEKLLAAKRGNITHVLIPRENERNLGDVPAKVRKRLKIELVDHMDEVLEKALVVKEGESVFQDVSLGTVYGDITVSTHNVPH